MQRSIIVLSPHLDDAVFSCADHIKGWLEQGDKVSVWTVFTAFSDGIDTPIARRQMELAGAATAAELEETRAREDETALAKLGVAGCRLGFMDAAFRTDAGRPLYVDG